MKSEAVDEGVRRIVSDKGLSGFGDALMNFLFSFAATKAAGVPRSAKVRNRDLAEAIRTSGLRRFLPSGMDRHALGNAAEALMAYAWLRGLITTEECVEILSRGVEGPVEAFKEVLMEVWRRLSNDLRRDP